VKRNARPPLIELGLALELRAPDTTTRVSKLHPFRSTKPETYRLNFGATPRIMAFETSRVTEGALTVPENSPLDCDATVAENASVLSTPQRALLLNFTVACPVNVPTSDGAFSAVSHETVDC